MMIATKNYEIGDVISTNSAFVYTLNEKLKGFFCNYCFKEKEVEPHLEFPRCVACKQVHYCDRTCQKNDWQLHKYECDIFRDHYLWLDKQMERAMLRLYLFLDKNPDQAQVTSHLTSDPNFKRCFDDLITDRGEILKNQPLMGICFETWDRLKKCNLSIQWETFLEYFCKNRNNYIEIMDGNGLNIGHGIYLVESFMTHSCVPNAGQVFHGSRIEIRAIKPIKSGDQITLALGSLQAPKSKRHMLSSRVVPRTCSCARCESNFDEEIDYDYLEAQLNFLSLCYRIEDFCFARLTALETLPTLTKIYDGLHPSLTIVMKFALELYFEDHDPNKGPLDKDLYSRTERMILLTHGPDHHLYRDFKEMENIRSNIPPSTYGSFLFGPMDEPMYPNPETVSLLIRIITIIVKYLRGNQ